MRGSSAGPPKDQQPPIPSLSWNSTLDNARPGLSFTQLTAGTKLRLFFKELGEICLFATCAQE